MKLIITRRPETNKNAHLPGDPEAPSAQGQEQLLHIAETCRNENVEAVVYSTQPRAAIAAEALAQTLHVPAIAEEGLRERNFGDWAEWEWSQIKAELDKLTAEERYTFVPPNGESWQQMEKRIQSALERIGDLGYNSVALITHWGPIRILLPMLGDKSKESTLQLDAANGETFVEEYSIPA